ncbi:MAG TPA: ATP-binding protein [Polyangiaceae bacterium]
MHKLLERQVRKHFGNALPDDQKLSSFLSVVDAAYQAGDSDRALLERSIELASSELFERNAQLERDLEAIKRLELELFQAEKLRAVGQLAAGIAHELNTPIQYVGDSVHFLKGAFVDLSKLGESVRMLFEGLAKGVAVGELLDALQVSASDVDLEYLLGELPKAFEHTIEGIRRVAQIVAAMKDFGRVDHGDKVLTDLARCIESTLTVAHNELKYVADVEVDLAPVPPVFCRAGELNQVLLNLLVNAAHAIADRFREQAQRGSIRIRTWQESESVVLSVSDNGCGIPEALKTRVFEPFFTTKPVGKGTGQGLAIARSIIEKQGGTLSFESQVEEGTTFYVRLQLDGLPAKAGPTADFAGDRQSSGS